MTEEKNSKCGRVLETESTGLRIREERIKTISKFLSVNSVVRVTYSDGCGVGEDS